MARIKDKINTQKHKELLANPKVQAMLKTIRYAEGTAGAGGYGTRVGGEQFSDFSKKPNKKVYIKSIGDYSSAEGAYQFLTGTWKGVSDKLGLKDFSPESQDIAAVDLIIQRGAMDDILNDNFQGAINKLSPEWASLPNSKGKGTYKNQKAKNLEKLAQVFYDGKPMTRPQQKQQEITPTVIDLAVPQISGNLATVPETAEESEDVVQATQKLQQKQAEENFLTELYTQREEQPIVEVAPQRQIIQQPSVLDRYAQIESFVDSPVVQQGGKIKLKDSKIEGKGIFTTDKLQKGDFIGLAHTNGQPSTELGRFHNHSEKPNSESVLIGSNRYIVTKTPIKKGEEITVDYRQQPELEQPEDFKNTPQLTEKEKSFLKLIKNNYNG